MNNPWIIDGSQPSAPVNTGAQLALELALNNTSPNLAATQTFKYYPTPGHTTTFKWGKGAFFSPTQIEGNADLLTFGSPADTIICVTGGMYEFHFPPIYFTQKGNGTASMLKVHIQPNGESGFVPYVIQMTLRSASRLVHEHWELCPATVFAVELEAGDQMKIGSCFRAYTSYSSAAVSGHYKAHLGSARSLMPANDQLTNIRIYKV